MVFPQIPSMAEIGTSITLVTNGACEVASSAVQQFIDSPTIAQVGFQALAAQIEVLEHLVTKLRAVAAGIAEVRTKLESTVQLEWHSPAGTAFRAAVRQRQDHADYLAQSANETVILANQGIEELRVRIAGLQSLLAAARAALGDTAAATIGQVCS